MDPEVELGPQVLVLRAQLDRFEAACRPEHLAATVACLERVLVLR